MSVVIKETDLPGVLIIESAVHRDPRGFFKELFHSGKYSDAGLEADFVQDNHSHSLRGVLRGFHYQLKYPQGKLITAISGEIFDVAVDVRRGSPHFGEWTCARLTSDNGKQLYIPPGFAHGFQVLSETADVVYKCTRLYHPEDEYGLLWSDKDISVDWPIKEPVLSDKDKSFDELKDISTEHLPVY